MAKRILKVVSTLALVALLFLAFINRNLLLDFLKGLSYSPTPEMSDIRENLGLTSAGARIFNASAPTLDDRDSFNRDCDSTNPDLAVFGCYYNDKIYVYNINSSDLAGFRESTTAHELLHAVWHRLSGVKKSELTPLLESVYASHRTELEESLKSYAESEKLDELYVRIGTQIKDLPDTLEAHYAEIFSDQDAVVAFYDSYVAPFNELNEKIETLSRELASLKTTIEEKTATYESRSSEFNASVDEFNRCANTAGCFSSDYVFRSRRNSLVATAGELDALYSELSNLIDSYNKKVDEYNSNILASENLQNLINSNAERKNL